MTSRIRYFLRYLSTLFLNGYFWGGLALLGLLAAGGYLLFNNVIMPGYTRHSVAVQVPYVLDRPYEQASEALRRHDLEVEQVVQRFNPSLPRGVVVDQNPSPQAWVKPGRRIYLTVNTGQTPKVLVPTLEGLSLREAQNRLAATGLKVGKRLPDPIPSPFSNTVTRQEPTPGDSLAEGDNVTLWYSTGLGDAYVEVPAVTEVSVAQARERLLRRKLRSVVVGAPEEGVLLDTLVVRRQNRAPGTRLREGSEIRLFVETDAPEEEEYPEPEEDAGAPQADL